MHKRQRQLIAPIIKTLLATRTVSVRDQNLSFCHILIHTRHIVVIQSSPSDILYFLRVIIQPTPFELLSFLVFLSASLIYWFIWILWNIGTLHVPTLRKPPAFRPIKIEASIFAHHLRGWPPQIISNCQWKPPVSCWMHDIHHCVYDFPHVQSSSMWTFSHEEFLH